MEKLSTSLSRHRNHLAVPTNRTLQPDLRQRSKGCQQQTVTVKSPCTHATAKGVNPFGPTALTNPFHGMIFFGKNLKDHLPPGCCCLCSIATNPACAAASAAKSAAATSAMVGLIQA